jgi:hypothetical protein
MTVAQCSWFAEFYPNLAGENIQMGARFQLPEQTGTCFSCDIAFRMPLEKLAQQGLNRQKSNADDPSPGAIRLVAGERFLALPFSAFDLDYRGTVRRLILIAEIRTPRYGKADLHPGEQSCQTESLSSTVSLGTNSTVL